MIWLLIAFPFLLLAIAPFLAGRQKGVIVRIAIALAVIFAIVDGLMMVNLVGGSSTGALSVGVIAILQLIVALLVLIAIPFVRRKSEPQ